MARAPAFRLLMIEDDESRIAVVTSWLPETCRLIAVRSAGRAIATLKRDEPKTYAGIMLDHDLQMQTTVAAESGRSGTDVVDVIISSVDRDVPILVHSMNPGRAPAMVRRLTAAGFLITYSPFAMLTALGFHRWINEVRELWEGYD